MDFSIPRVLIAVGFTIVASSPDVWTTILVESVNPLESDIVKLNSPLELVLVVNVCPFTNTVTVWLGLLVLPLSVPDVTLPLPKTSKGFTFYVFHICWY